MSLSDGSHVEDLRRSLLMTPPLTGLLASAAHLKTKRSDRSRVKWVKLAVLHNKSKLTVQVSMVTVLSGAMRDPKVNQLSLRRLRPHAGFYLQPPEMGR